MIIKMSRFLSKSASAVKPYTPGEQPQGMRYIKLNTNENPYPPSPAVLAAFSAFDANDLRLYPDPTALNFRTAVAESRGLKPEQVFAGCGSDEVLAFAFMAFFDRGDRIYFPDVTYAFYSVYADLFGLCAAEIPLSDYAVKVQDYFGLDGNIILANPNAPTGICLSIRDVEQILKANPDRLVIIDEAYIDFSGEDSSVGLIGQYDNLLVVQTFSKSLGLAGMRLGLGFGNPELIAALERIKYSFSPYNLDRVALSAGIAAVKDSSYTAQQIEKIIKTRERTAEAIGQMGYTVLPSRTNFIFVKGPMDGAELFGKLRDSGILVRYFNTPKTKDFVRITVGTDDEMDILIKRLGEFV